MIKVIKFHSSSSRPHTLVANQEVTSSRKPRRNCTNESQPIQEKKLRSIPNCLYYAFLDTAVYGSESALTSTLIAEKSYVFPGTALVNLTAESSS